MRLYHYYCVEIKSKTQNSKYKEATNVFVKTEIMFNPKQAKSNSIEINENNKIKTIGTYEMVSKNFIFFLCLMLEKHQTIIFIFPFKNQFWNENNNCFFSLIIAIFNSLSLIIMRHLMEIKISIHCFCLISNGKKHKLSLEEINHNHKHYFFLKKQKNN